MAKRKRNKQATANEEGGVSVLLSTVRQALSDESPEALAEGLRHMATQEPDRWVDLLLLNDLVGQPQADLQKALKTPRMVLGWTETAIGQEMYDSEALLRLAQSAAAAVDISRRLSTLSEMLKATAFASSSPATMVLRVAAYIESQWRTALTLSPDLFCQGGCFNASRATSSVLVSAANGSNATMQEAVEQTCEASELILRWIAHKYGMDHPLDADATASPYEGRDFQVVLTTAAVWQALNDIWSRVRFGQWRPSLVDGSWVYTPADIGDYRRYAVSIRRDSLFEIEFFCQLMQTGKVTGSDTPELIAAISDSMTVPPAGAPWNGVVNVDLLRLAAQAPLQSQITDLFLSFRHYAPLLAGLQIGDEKLDFPTWKVCLSVLRVLGEAFQQATESYHHPSGDERLDCLGQVVVVGNKSIRKLLRQVTGLPADKCAAAAKALTLDRDRKKLEIWDQPLLPIAKGASVLSPATMALGSPWRAVENLITQYGGQFSLRGGPFEEHILSELNRRSGIRAAHVTVKHDAREWEFDVVAAWRDHIFLIEAKCLKSMTEAGDDYRGRKEIQRSVEQLRERYAALPNCWSLIREKHPALALPEQLSQIGHVGLISVNNTTRFSGETHGDVVVTDDLCMFRYFGGPIEQLTQSAEGTILEREVLHHLHDGKPASPSGWLEYLRNPPHIADIGSSVEIQAEMLLWPSDGSPRIMFPVAKFS